jgi:putative hemolysin
MLAKEVDRLSSLCDLDQLSVYLARAREIPNVLAEIGRLRESTFRQAGEGTGRPVDLDSFDARYLHLFVWNRGEGEVVGAYRLGPTPDILPAQGAGGLYTSTLFRFSPELFARTGPAVELGRSFIRPEYQRQYAPLLLLWKGIARYIVARPECPILFGAVSISRQYSPASRELLVSFLESRRDPALAPLVTARRPFRHERAGRWHARALARFVLDVEDLGEPIADIEEDGKGVPILVRQYLKLGGKVLGCNVDPCFADVVDALIMVDLRETPPALLARYMSREGLASFCRHHRRAA